jgi:tRNA(fMet)-specific endonuclease VapC
VYLRKLRRNASDQFLGGSTSDTLVLDTDIMISFLRGYSDAIEKMQSLEANDDLSTTIITAYELLKGASSSKNVEENVARVQDSVSRLQILNLSMEACEAASRVFERLKHTGVLIGEFDMLIAGIVLSQAEETTLVTRDQHFRSIKGIKIIKW